MRGSVRVVGGKWRGRRLEIPKGARPTSERAREALFDILGPAIAGRTFLELFAGSGAVAIEALSRGASDTVAADVDPTALRANRNALGAHLEILSLPADGAVARLLELGRVFEIVFADPPYGQTVSPSAWEATAALVADGGLLILQADTGVVFEKLPPSLILERVARYGRNSFHFFRKAP